MLMRYRSEDCRKEVGIDFAALSSRTRLGLFIAAFSRYQLARKRLSRGGGAGRIARLPVNELAAVTQRVTLTTPLVVLYVNASERPPPPTLSNRVRAGFYRDIIDASHSR